jgi:lipopolysaccharide transport system permease protein
MQIVLERGRVEKNYWRDVWRYRELFQVLAWRDVAVRYKQTVIGVMGRDTSAPYHGDPY